MSEKSPFTFYARPTLQSPSLLVSWNEDAGKLGAKVVSYLNSQLGGKEFAEIEPPGFFALGGVSIEDDVAQFPESKFYSCQEKNIVTFRSNSPNYDYYRFLNLILDMGEHCHITELYTIGGIITLTAHTAPRQLLGVANSPRMKEVLRQHNIATDMDYEAPPGQRPTLSSFLLWVAKRRHIDAAGLWVSIPFYLAASEDPQAGKKALEFLDHRFGLGIDFGSLRQEVVRQYEKLAQLRTLSPDVDTYIRRLEANLGLTAEENERLIKETEEFLRKKD